MAEIVGLHVESMIPELEQMKRIKLYTKDEITEIIKRRKEHEYKIARKTKEKQDFLRYISYEVKLLHDIKLRRDKHKISEKKSEIEYTIAKRVVKLYNLVISYFKSDVSLWISYINFCTQVHFTSVVTEAFKELLQVHGEKCSLWKIAAKWEIEESHNIDGALNYIMTGLHRHPESSELYLQAFRLELMAAKYKRAADTETTEEEQKEKALKRAEVHFREALKRMNDVGFIVSMLEVATEFDYTRTLQNTIIEYLTTNCWKSVEMWDAMAQRELNGYHYKEGETKNAVKLCIAVYKAAVKALPTPEMWEKFIERLIEIHTQNLEVNIRNTIVQTFQDAYKADILREKHFSLWIQLLENDEKQLDVLKMATARIPSSVELWLARIRYHIVQNDELTMTDISKQAIVALGKNALPIYRSIIQYYQLENKNSEIRMVFEEGIAQCPEISLPLRSQYIEWINVTRNTKFAKQEYDKLAQLTPYCLDLHLKMVQLELGRFNPCIASIRNIYKLACQQLGADNTEVWISQIKFELMHGDPMFVSNVYYSAKGALNSDLVSKFTTEYAILNTQA